MGPERGHKQLAAGCSYIQPLESTSSGWRFTSTTNPCAPDEKEPDLGITENRSMLKGKAPDLSFVPSPDSLGSPVSKMRAIHTPSLRALRQRQTPGGERFGLKANPRQSSIGPVNVGFPQSEFRAAHTKTYASKSDAIWDLYQNHDNYSDHCLFDGATQTIFPHASDTDFKSHPPADSEGLEFLWLPMESFPDSRRLGVENKSPEMFSNSSFRTISLSEEFRVDRLDDILNNLYIRDQSTPVWGSEGDCGDPEGIVPLEHPSSVERDSNDLGYPDVRISVREISNSISRGLTCGKDLAELVGMDNLNDKTLDNEIARRYINSIFSSSNDSLLTDQKSKPAGSNSADSVWSKIEDSRAEQAKRVKTWAELGKDFLDIYAPFDQINPEQRAQLAVYNALSVRGGLQNDFATECETPSSDSSHNSNEIDQSIRSRDGDSDGGITLRHIEDIARCESAKEPSPQATEELCTMNREATQGQGPEVVYRQPPKHPEEVDITSESEQSGELAMPFLSLWAESDEFRGKLYMKEPALCTQSIGPKFDNAIFDLENSQVEASESTLANGRHWSCARSETLRTSLFEKNLTLPHEQSGAAEGASKEASSRCISAEIVACFGEQSLGTSNGFMEFPITENQRDDKITNWKWKCPDSAMGGSVAAKVAIDMEFDQTMRRVPILTYAPAEKSSSLPLAQTPFADLNRMNSFVSPTFLDSDSGVMQIPRPNVRNVLAPKVLTSDNPETTRHTVHGSDAETEESETFGEKLRRYERAKQDEKENEEQWWRDFVLYG
jgi:hypothetical protein